MKKLMPIALLCLFICSMFAGCGVKEKYDRLNYTGGLKGFVELSDYKSIVVDRNSEEYLKIEESLLNNDFSYYPQKLEEGEVVSGDTVNIDYAGKVGGVAFTGGTTQGNDLTIGSKSFIDGFEDQLIGVKVKETVDIKVTFPADYNDSTDLETGSKTIKLAGQEAIFTVTVNSISRKFTEVNDEFAKAAGFEDAEAYNTDLKKRAAENFVLSDIITNSKVTSVPDDKYGNSFSFFKSYYTSYAQQNGATFEQFLQSNGITEDGFKLEVLKNEMVFYACLDDMAIKLPENAVKDMTAKMVEQTGATETEIISYYTENYIEYFAVQELLAQEIMKVVQVKE
ncbi:MAG: FKBP-type peptidyl-prolyl cis-trans isomerase [Acutalibacteraceae bacterium]|nr:FKBP-type peptidyl-prolyl cis-trans isomerase [Acutalibacteraceae bacterium]